jgi:hypothetical protein
MILTLLSMVRYASEHSSSIEAEPGVVVQLCAVVSLYHALLYSFVVIPLIAIVVAIASSALAGRPGASPLDHVNVG